MLGYVIIASETPFEAARQGSFPLAFAKTNKHDAPVVTVLVSSGITQLFLIVSYVAASTYQSSIAAQSIRFWFRMFARLPITW